MKPGYGTRVAVLAALAQGCRPEPVVATNPPTLPVVPDAAATRPLETPEQTVRTLERRLLDAARVQVVFAIESHGAVEAKLRGILVVGPDHRMLLDAQGTFAGEVGVARIECDGTTMRGHSGNARLEMPCPSGLAPALLLGLVRMGVLHNVARAWSAKPPETSTTPPRDATAAPAEAMDAWVTSAKHRPAQTAVSSGEGGTGVAFDIIVDGQPVGDAMLLLDAAGLPTLREQTVHFPGGPDEPDSEMHVVERYESVELTAR